MLATPAVRRLCRELSIDLASVDIVGTGPEGRVLKHDVLAYAKGADGAVDEREGVRRSPEALLSGAAAEVVEGGKRQGREPVVVPIKGDQMACFCLGTRGCFVTSAVCCLLFR